MRILDPALRRALRARAHHLHPVVSIGQQGLTPAVLHEIDVNLLAHELVKVRVFSDARDEREALLERVCSELDAAPVQHLGKVLVIYREAAVEEAARRRPAAADRDASRGQGDAARAPKRPAKVPAARRNRLDGEPAAGKSGTRRRTAAVGDAGVGKHGASPGKARRGAGRNAPPPREDRREERDKRARDTGPIVSGTGRRKSASAPIAPDPRKARGGPAGVPRAPKRRSPLPPPAPAAGASRTRRRRG